jgi:hypothetical protein
MTLGEKFDLLMGYRRRQQATPTVALDCDARGNQLTIRRIVMVQSFV